MGFVFSPFGRPAACGALVPRPGMELVPPVVEARSLNHWTASEVLEKTVFEFGSLIGIEY